MNTLRTYLPFLSASTPTDERSSATYTALYLGGLMLFAALLSFFFFSGQSLRLDEAQSLWHTSREPVQIINTIAKDVHVPLYTLTLHFWRAVLGESVEVARVLSLVFYLLSIPALYFLGKLTYGRSAGLFAATLLAISPFMNWYGNEIRMYAMFTFLVIVNQYCFLRIFKKENDHAWAWYVITAALGIFTHYFFFLLFLAQAVFFFLRRPAFPEGALRKFVFSAMIIGACFAPWAYYVFSVGEAVNQQPLLSTPDSVNIFSTFSQFLFGFQDDHLNTFFLSLWPLTIIFSFLALRRNNPVRPETEYFLLTVLLSVSVAFIISVTLRPVFVSRYLILAVPSLYLLLTGLFAIYAPRASLIVRVGLVALMLATLGTEIANPATPVKEDYRQAVTYLENNASAQDVVLLSAPFTLYPVEYYYRGVAPIETLPLWDRYTYGAVPPFIEENLPAEVTSVTEDYQYAWLLLSYDQGYQEDIRIYFDTHFERVSRKNFSPGLDLYVYKLRYDTPLSRIDPLSRAQP